jgi:hypothetical protein
VQNIIVVCRKLGFCDRKALKIVKENTRRPANRPLRLRCLVADFEHKTSYLASLGGAKARPLLVGLWHFHPGALQRQPEFLACQSRSLHIAVVGPHDIAERPENRHGLTPGRPELFRLPPYNTAAQASILSVMRFPPGRTKTMRRAIAPRHYR